jgi:site-specific DNA-methyltransferase (adenine-specific)
MAYYEDEWVTLHHGDCRQVLPELSLTVDCVIADPPYAETSLAWDRWPDGWPDALISASRSMWCFGSMRMFLDRRDDFTAWKLSQDVIWQKRNGTGLAIDRFRRVHEHALHWYRGEWSRVHHETPRVAADPAALKRNGNAVRVARAGAHLGNSTNRSWEDDGTRLMQSVIAAPSVRHGGHPTEKPVELLDPLIRYACPPGGVVLDPFAGSGSTAAAARLSGRRSVLIEADERYCEAIARRLDQGVLQLDECEGAP